VHPGEQVLDTAMEIARDMATHCSPLVMAMHKRLMWKAQDMSLDQFAELETKALHHTMERPDAVEGGAAFFEKREPVWQSSVNNDWLKDLD
jgi:enoyl-CoA hydratase/carnithine racemase